ASRQLLGLPAAPHITSRSQKRLDTAFQLTAIPPRPGFLRSRDLKCLLVELDANFGLQAFQTLNDRGKDLTILEKLKSLWMEYDLQNVAGGATGLVRSIHHE